MTDQTSTTPHALSRNATRCAEDARRVASRLLQLRVSLLCTLVLLGAVGCNTLPRSINAEGQVQHVVICWLKPGGDRAAVIQSANELAKIDGVLDVAVGGKIAGTRPMVENTFDIALIVTFENEAALRAYENDPIHKRVVEQVVKPNVEKYVVYDAALESYAISEKLTADRLKIREEALRKQEEMNRMRRQ